MDKIIQKLRPLAAFIGICCLMAYLTFTFIAAVGQMAEGAGAGSFIGWYIIAAFIGLTVFAFFIKKKELLKVLVILLLSYYAMRSIFGAGNAFTFGAEGVGLAYQIFNMFALLCLLAAFVLYLLQLIFPKLKSALVIRIIIYALLAAHVFFSFVGWILYTVYIAEYAWFWVIDGIGTMLFIPAAFLFGFMYFNEEGEDKDIFAKKEKAPKEEKKEEVKAEPKEEAPAEEPKAEEAPAE